MIRINAILLIYYLSSISIISYCHIRLSSSSHRNYNPIHFKTYYNNRNYNTLVNYKFHDLHLRLLCKDFDINIDDHNEDNDNDDGKTIILQTTTSPTTTTTTITTTTSTTITATTNPLKQLICHFNCDDINSEEISELLFEAGCLSGTCV